MNIWKKVAKIKRQQCLSLEDYAISQAEEISDLLNAIDKALIEICATCIYPDSPYDREAFPQLDNPEDRKCLANAIGILRDALGEQGNERAEQSQGEGEGE